MKKAELLAAIPHLICGKCGQKVYIHLGGEAACSCRTKTKILLVSDHRSTPKEWTGENRDNLRTYMRFVRDMIVAVQKKSPGYRD
jgi:hypothetical protein